MPGDGRQALFRASQPASEPDSLPHWPGLKWLQGDLHDFDADHLRVDVVFSCGPLDHFSRWWAASRIDAGVVVAFGSTSVLVKQASCDQQERELAQRLKTAEQALLAHCRQRGITVTVLRRTLVWGAGRDRSVSAIAALAARSGLFVLPASATGARQPVHVADLAQAALAVLGRPQCDGRSYNLGGGQVLAYRAMVAAVLAALPCKARLWVLPDALFSSVLWLAQRSGRLRSITPAVRARMGEDLVFACADAQRDFAYAPRGFAPTAAELGQAQ